MSNVYSGKKQQTLLERLLCKLNFMPVEINCNVTSSEMNCVCCPYLLKASSYLFKKAKKVFF